MTDIEKTYTDLIQEVCSLYAVTAEVEHEKVMEFFEGDIPLFKLILAQVNEIDEKPQIILSFHLETNSVYAIQWFLRLQDLCPDLKITHCYVKDASGATHVGEDAEIVNMYRIEQEVISAWIRENEQTDEENFENKLTTETAPVEDVYTDRRKALLNFNKIRKSKKGEYH